MLIYYIQLLHLLLLLACSIIQYLIGLPLAVDGVWQVKSTNTYIAVEFKEVRCILVEFSGTTYINELVDIFETD